MPIARQDKMNGNDVVSFFLKTEEDVIQFIHKLWILSLRPYQNQFFFRRDKKQK